MSIFSGGSEAIFGRILGRLLGAFSVQKFVGMGKIAFFGGVHARRDASADRFRNRFWSIFGRVSGVKNEEKCRRVCLFLSFAVFKMNSIYSRIWERLGPGFGRILGVKKRS